MKSAEAGWRNKHLTGSFDGDSLYRNSFHVSLLCVQARRPPPSPGLAGVSAGAWQRGRPRVAEAAGPQTRVSCRVVCCFPDPLSLHLLPLPSVQPGLIRLILLRGAAWARAAGGARESRGGSAGGSAAMLSPPQQPESSVPAAPPPASAGLGGLGVLPREPLAHGTWESVRLQRVGAVVWVAQRADKYLSHKAARSGDTSHGVAAEHEVYLFSPRSR